MDLTVCSYNIHKGVGTDRRRDLPRIAAVIAELDADILALQEADTRLGTRTGLLDMHLLARATGLHPVGLTDVGPAHGWHGNVLLLRNASVDDVHQMALPGLEPRGALITDVRIGHHALRVVNTHLGLLARSRLAQAHALIDRLAALHPRPTLLMGDLNEWRSTAPCLTVLHGCFAPAASRPSFPARYPVLALDRMMTQPPATLRDPAAHASPLARKASDHLPVIARWHLPAGPPKG